MGSQAPLPDFQDLAAVSYDAVWLPPPEDAAWHRHAGSASAVGDAQRKLAGALAVWSLWHVLLSLLSLTGGGLAHGLAPRDRLRWPNRCGWRCSPACRPAAARAQLTRAAPAGWYR